MKFTAAQKEILCTLLEQPRCPIVRFELHREDAPELCSVALNYVRIEHPEDTQEMVQQRADALQTLMEQGVVFIDYTVRAWVQGDFDVYYRSKLYEKLCHTVMESSKDPAAVFDLPYMRKGYACFTPGFLQQLPRP